MLILHGEMSQQLNFSAFDEFVGFFPIRLWGLVFKNFVEIMSGFNQGC